jgi:siroheme synthase
MARRDAERIYVGKVRADHCLPQDGINALLVRLAREGRKVVRLKGGDPFVFGRGGEEAEALEAAGIAYEVVPGVTAALACAAQARIPLTHRDVARAVMIVTGHTKHGEPDIDFAAAARPGTTLAVYMGIATLPRLRDGLRDAGRPHRGGRHGGSTRAARNTRLLGQRRAQLDRRRPGLAAGRRGGRPRNRLGSAALESGYNGELATA